MESISFDQKFPSVLLCRSWRMPELISRLESETDFLLWPSFYRRFGGILFHSFAIRRRNRIAFLVADQFLVVSVSRYSDLDPDMLFEDAHLSKGYLCLCLSLGPMALSRNLGPVSSRTRAPFVAFASGWAAK